MEPNRAAWLDQPNQALRVGPAEKPVAGEREDVIRNRAIAINPVSWKIQDKGLFIQKWPVILDYDVAGEIHEVGVDVSHFAKGDRVVAFVDGPISQESKRGAFQLYSVARAVLVSKLPENIPFAEACVLPVALNTALVSICAPPSQGFGLPAPSLDPQPFGKTIVVWGASSSAGCLALQVARAAGITAIAIASASNHELCTSLGAVEALDYHKPSIVDDVVRAVRTAGGDFVGVLDTISNPDQSLKYCIQVLEQLGGGQLGILDPLLQPQVSENIKVTKVLGYNDMTHAFWTEYLTPALEQGKLKCSPEPLVVGQGLESLQKALDAERMGVSAKKVVVTL